MASSSSPPVDFDPSRLSSLPLEIREDINLRRINDTATERIFTYQSILIRNYGFRVLGHLPIHPEYPFLRPYSFLDISGTIQWVWPKEFLCLLWYFLHKYSIALEIRPQRFLVTLKHLVRGRRVNPYLCAFLEWFKPLDEWCRVLANEMPQLADHVRPELRAILVFHRPCKSHKGRNSEIELEVNPRVFVYQTNYFSMYENYYDHPESLVEFQHFMCAQNNVPPKILWPIGCDRMPQFEFSPEYQQKILEDKRFWESRQRVIRNWPSMDQFSWYPHDPNDDDPDLDPDEEE